MTDVLDRLKAAIAILLTCAVTPFACGEGPTEPSLVVAVTPASATLVSVGETVQLTARVLDADGNEIVGNTFTWSSSDESVATTGTLGLVTAVASGAATITATTDGISGSASVAVCIACPVAVMPTDTLVMAGDTVRFRGVALDDNGDTIPGVTFTWQAGAADVATVDEAGLAHAVGIGVTAITALVGGDTAHALFAVGTQGGPPRCTTTSRSTTAGTSG